MPERLLEDVAGKHDLAIDTVSPGRTSDGYYYGFAVEIRGVVLRSTVSSFVGNRFLWTCAIAGGDANMLRNFLSSAYRGTHFATVCLNLEGWCKVERNSRRPAVSVEVRGAQLRFAISAEIPAPTVLSLGGERRGPDLDDEDAEVTNDSKAEGLYWRKLDLDDEDNK